MNRWIIYQRERFPLVAYVPMVAAFSGSAVCLSSLLRDRVAMPPWPALLVACVTTLLVFLQLRIADEFKDADEDARVRAYRPVPRGLVTLAELRRIGVAAAIVQLLLAIWLSTRLLWILAAVWGCFALMTREFFVPEWLRARPLLYMTSHMLIMPLIDLYATACDWLVAGLHRPPAGLGWFLLLSFFNGMVIELGRKIRMPEDEEPGVDTYSRMWGGRTAVLAWLAALALTAVCAIQVARQLTVQMPVAMGFSLLLASVLASVLALCGAVAYRFARGVQSGAAVNAVSGVWTLVLYLSLGPAPLAAAFWRA